MGNPKPPIPMKNDVMVRNIREFKEHWDIDKALLNFHSGKLLKWLNDRYYEDEVDKFEQLSKDDPELPQKLGAIFGFHVVEPTGGIDLPLMARINKLKQYTANPKIWAKVKQVAFNQEELVDRLDEDYDEIYLCSSSDFRIPLKVNDKRYIGVDEGGVVVTIKSDVPVNFEVKNIEFINIKFDDEYQKILDDLIPKPEDAERFYELGKEAEKIGDNKKAIEFYTKSAKLNHTKAMNRLADAYFDGDIVGKNYKTAFNWCEKSADFGDIEGIINLATMYNRGQGVTEDKRKALELYKKAAELGNDTAMQKLGDIYGFADPPNSKEAMKWYQKAIDSNNTEAMISIAMMYEFGYGVPEDINIAIGWLKRAIESDNTFAMYILGDIYRKNGNLVEAIKLYKQAADKKNGYAMNAIGLLYKNGHGVAKDENLAFEWFQRSATANNYEGMANLGYCYLMGEGTTKNLKQAYSLLKKSAEAENIFGMKYFGAYFEYMSDYVKAIEWY